MTGERRQRTQELALTDEARRVLAAVEERPACNLTDARQCAGMGRHVFEAALDGLVEAGLVHRVATGRGVLLLPDRPGIEECVEQVKALWDPRVRRLHDFLGDYELCPREGILEHAGKVWGWDAEATRWRLRSLEKAELAQAILDLRDHRRITYRCLPAHPVAREILGEADPGV